MTPADLAALHARCFTTPRPFTAAEFEDLLGLRGYFLCALPQGFALGRAIADEAELVTIAVAPEARRCGAGTMLMQAFETEAIARGAATALLEVAEDNAAARALYDATGYLPAGRRKGYYQTPDGASVDALILRKMLPKA